MGHHSVKCAATNLTITGGDCYAGQFKFKWESDFYPHLTEPISFGQYDTYGRLDRKDEDSIDMPDFYLHSEVFEELKNIWVSECEIEDPDIRSQDRPKERYLKILGFEKIEEIPDTRYNKVYVYPDLENISVRSDGSYVKVYLNSVEVKTGFYTLKAFLEFINRYSDHTIDDSYFDQNPFASKIDECLEWYDKMKPELVKAKGGELVNTLILRTPLDRLPIHCDNKNLDELFEVFRTKEGKQSWVESLTVWRNLQISNVGFSKSWFTNAGCQDGAMVAEENLHNIAGKIIKRLKDEDEEQQKEWENETD